VCGDSWLAMCCAISSLPLFFRYAVMPVARNVWFPIRVLMPAPAARRASCCHMARSASVPVFPAVVRNSGASRSPAIPAAAMVFVQEPFQIVVTRDLVFLATFFVQPDPAAASLHEIVTHFHLEHGIDAREGVNHHAADERAIAQPDKCRFLCFRMFVACRLPGDREVARGPRWPSSRASRLFSRRTWGRARRGRGWVEDVAVTSQSKSIRGAARCCFTVGAKNDSAIRGEHTTKTSTFARLTP